eukprot:gene28777-30872_t
MSSNSMSMLGYNLDSAVGTEDLGGCGWSKCYNCLGKDGKPTHCGPDAQTCMGNPPKYTFHLNDKTCDINDPNGQRRPSSSF